MAIHPECQASVAGQVLPRGTGIRWEIGTHNPLPNRSHQNVLAQFQHGRDIFLASDCEWFLTFEHDMTMPPDAVAKLLAVGKPVVYGVYLLRHGSLVLNSFEYIGGKNLGESLSLYPGKLPKRGEVVRVSGAGFGCTLMRRDVVERFGFHKGEDADQWAPDVPFALDCVRNGVEQWAHFGVLCDHFDEGVRLRPFEGSVGTMVKVTALENVVVSVQGDGPNNQIRRLEKGQVYELPRRGLEDLVRAGYVTVLEDSPLPNPLPGGEGTGGGEGTREAAAFDGAPERAVLKTARRKGREL